MKFIDERTNNGEFFIKLICSDGIKYSDFRANVNQYKNDLSIVAGIYHFYSVLGDSSNSLYVGKAGFGKKNNWNLYKRILQHHTHKSQPDTIHGAISKEFSIESSKVINFLAQGNVYFQYLVIHQLASDNPPPDNLDKNILEIECYCKSRLNPKYTDK